MSRVAIVQESSIVLNRDKTIEKAVLLIHEAALSGAELVVFPEAYISGYPAWIWRLRPGIDWGTSEALHGLLLESSVNIDTGDLAPLCDAAKANQVTVVCGLNERGNERSRATLYNTVVIISAEGKLVNRHRKLMPTNPERMVWGFGDGSSLKVVESPIGRLSTLLCWENYMPLARYALYAQGVEIYIAPTYDSGDAWLGTMQHIAREGRCWVISCGVVLEHKDLPDDFPDKESLYPDIDEWINPGDSVIIAPGGAIVAGPLRKEKGILYADIDIKLVAISKRALDVVGHYSRPDIFTLNVNTQVQNSIKIK
ncbi:carbon-nitrogen hydrolase family protein [Shewanella violacea]|uniref:Nitrilase, putative n=1 Tax=Shewanella violacea (strain JCM 10179 / CIP 106290 / LMG 19151 / DSS12) TaxID=637905 RepID=D4ZCY7_SHEVD|nr:carbon-nitrogen hydrolase family protein [Shewanella violacea]BAJ03882.1 nitrilase, putative [Shewanella violacea DSS12]